MNVLETTVICDPVKAYSYRTSWAFVLTEFTARERLEGLLDESVSAMLGW